MSRDLTCARSGPSGARTTCWPTASARCEGFEGRLPRLLEQFVFLLPFLDLLFAEPIKFDFVYYKALPKTGRVVDGALLPSKKVG